MVEGAILQYGITNAVNNQEIHDEKRKNISFENNFSASFPYISVICQHFHDTLSACLQHNSD